MKILHIVPGLDDAANGMAVVARLIAKEQGGAQVVDLSRAVNGDIVHADEIWVHGMWLPKAWMICRRALKAGKRLVRMVHGSLSPVYLKYQSPFKKCLVGPIERYWLGKADRILATCKAEKGWIEKYLGKRSPKIEVMDLKRFFELRGSCSGLADNQKQETGNQKLNLLYLGRRHPLKGVEYLEEAVREIKNDKRETLEVELKIVSDAFGEEKERIWNWCDVLVLPTLSENFGLVVAEALERGKRVITTDGAPVWGEESGEVGERLIYLKGYRDGTKDERVRQLKEAILACLKQ